MVCPSRRLGRGRSFARSTAQPRWRRFKRLERVGLPHVLYVSVAHPAPIMRDYIAVRRACEAAIEEAGLVATIMRPWYILGPGHWWPLVLQPWYRLLERIPNTRMAATRLGLVTMREMLTAMVWAIEQPPDRWRVMDVSEIRRRGVGES